MLVVIALVALITTTALALARSARADADSHAPVRYHVVMPGETLWGIATELTPRPTPVTRSPSSSRSTTCRPAVSWPGSAS